MNGDGLLPQPHPHTVALRFCRALRASVLYGTEARKAQKIIGDTVSSRDVVVETRVLARIMASITRYFG